MNKLKKFLLILVIVLVFGYYAKSVFSQDGGSVLYVPLIGITSVPEPLSLPKGPGGNVTYHYAVKSFLSEVPLTNVKVVDDKCSPVEFVEGDDNSDRKLDNNETWRYECTTELYNTTESIATATGVANNLTAIDKAYTTVIVGSKNPAPLVSIVNITKVAYPLSLPAEGGEITFTYRVNNPGAVPLSGVSVSDDKCANISNRLGDTNGNKLLDLDEVWTYTCNTSLKETTTNTAHVTAYANGLKAVDEVSITVKVATPSLPDTGISPELKIIIWIILASVLATLIFYFLFLKRKNESR